MLSKEKKNNYQYGKELASLIPNPHFHEGLL